jgi:hypothetical protein
MTTRRIHLLKADPQTFDDVANGLKRAEIRFNDRGYRVGDVLELYQTQHSFEEMQAGAPLIYTGWIQTLLITHVQSGYGLKDGHVALSFEEYVA